ncbi:hypothetical protein [Deinococcus actinosclerus]|uniref:Uncharacterized protein n=1 Tax=Deinococcus actinosclerus TaxID=1768108 RepID=A0ABM5X7N0_9DEIO|nr:hypothetical protein [Deinococcus actinosclerus]ALW89631.1 hypothetical protein AUC44_12580 [Deinococcus actinosclerus]
MTASKRSRAEILAEVTSGLVSIRQQQRDARAEAEAWYRALQAWDTAREGGEIVVGAGPRPSKTSRMQVVGIGQYGGPPGGAIWYTKLRLPHAWVSESAVAALCNTDPLLGRIREGQGPATLLRETGAFVHPVDRAREYALAVLTLGAQLGDTRALAARNTLLAFAPASPGE